MSDYIVSARKYRPVCFDDVVGQSALTTTLKNAISSGKLAHAYLFCGPRGVGKTTCARIFAKTINCLSPKPDGEACGTCESCRAFDEGRSYNIHELDAASNNSVEDIRSLIEQVQIPPQVGRYKVFIIDEVHMLSAAAFNAFLKTLEEPPAHAIFILATTEKHKILPTILSRCQIYDFARMKVEDIVNHLKKVATNEGIKYEEEALGVIARKADGGMRDALSIFDQAASFSEGDITYKKVIEDLGVLDYEYYFRLTDQILAKDIPGALLTVGEVLEKGFDGGQFMGGLASHFRDLLVSRDEATLRLLEVADSVKHKYQEQAKKCSPKMLYRALRLCNDCDINYRTSNNKRLLVELTVIEVAQADDDDSCGRGPTKILKPIFSAAKAATPQAATATQQTPRPAQPQAPAAPQPAPAATTSVTAATAVGESAKTYHTTPQAPQATAPKPLKMPHTISIRKPVEAPASTAASGTGAQAGSQATPTVTEEKPFDQDGLLYQWFRFAGALPQEQTAMAGRMKGMKPTILPGWQIDVPLENKMVMGYMEQLRTQLTDFLRQNLQNGKIELKFRIIEQKEETRAFTRREVLEKMMEKNPDFARFAKALQLELA